MKSYVSKRKYQTKINSKLSNISVSDIGLPQGLIFSPLLSIIYINYIFRKSEKLFFILFADDTTPVLESENYPDLVNECNVDSENLKNWTVENR